MDNIRAIPDKRIVDMTSGELECLYRVVRAVEASVANANRTFAIQQARAVSDLAFMVREELSAKKAYSEKNRTVKMADDLLNLHMLAPADFFDQLGGTMSALYQ